MNNLSHGLDFANAKSCLVQSVCQYNLKEISMPNKESKLIYKEESEKILKACFEVHNELGNGFLEPVYQEALELEFKSQKIPYEREKLLPIFYKGKILDKKYYADFVCYTDIVLELKAVSVVVKAHKAQVLNYLKAADKKLGYLVNFGNNSLTWERITRFN